MLLVSKVGGGLPYLSEAPGGFYQSAASHVACGWASS
jgi:hypothetical protein